MAQIFQENSFVIAAEEHHFMKPGSEDQRIEHLRGTRAAIDIIAEHDVEGAPGRLPFQMRIYSVERPTQQICPSMHIANRIDAQSIGEPGPLPQS
jgi:hypothetical protein